MDLGAQVRDRLSKSFQDLTAPVLSHGQWTKLLGWVTAIVEAAEQGTLRRERTEAQLPKYVACGTCHEGLAGPASECCANQTRRSVCCYDGCEAWAEYEIVDGPTPDDFTHSCAEHLGFLIQDRKGVSCVSALAVPAPVVV